jgi:anti-sigma-K factor RskA
MSAPTQIPPFDDNDRLAAEHVLGLLEGENAKRAERLAVEDPAFQASVERWRMRFSELDETAPRHTPSIGLWRRIEESLGEQTASAARPAAARRDESAQRASGESSLRAIWSNLAWWRGIGMAGAFASLILAVGLTLAIRAGNRTPVLVAVLLSDTNRPAAVVNAFADGRTELVPLEAIPVPQGRTLQVWTLWDRERGPVSVGVLDAARSAALALRGLPKPAPNQLFEITLEPTGGSPTGRPTGPVLMKGNAVTAL